MKSKVLSFLFLLFFALIFMISGCEGTIGPQGPQGSQGIQGEPGNGISSIKLTKTEGKVDTYTIYFTDGSTTTFTVTNGTDGETGAQGIQGIQGEPGKDGHTPVITVVDGYWYIDGENTNVLAEGLKGEPGKDGLSAYEIFLKYYPDYTGTEEEWIYDILCGNKCNLFGHDYDENVIEGPCNSYGYIEYICNICGHTYRGEDTSFAEHNFVNDICTDCGYSELLENAEYYIDSDGWIVARSAESVYYLVGYCGDGVVMRVPSHYDGNELNFTLFDTKTIFKKYRTTITRVSFPYNFYKPIPLGCFSYCENLEVATIGNGVTEIGMFAFSDCKKLTNLSIGTNVKSIGYCAFLLCESLSYVQYNAINASCNYYDERHDNEYINNWECFSICGINTDGITLEIGDLVEFLPADLFRMDPSFPREYHFNVKEINISPYSSLREIGNECFQSSDIEKVFLPISFEKYNLNSFYDCTIENIYYYGDEYSFRQIENYDQIKFRVNFYSEEDPNLSDSEFYYQIIYSDDGREVYEIVSFSYNGEEILYIPSTSDGYNVVSIGSYIYYGGEIKIVVVPNDIECIAYDAFEGFYSLNTIIFTGSKVEWNSIVGEYSYMFDKYNIVCVNTESNYWHGSSSEIEIW